jgi:Bcr/CflA subfamily drug resistance transporter
MNILKFNRSLSIMLIALLLGFPQISETIYTPSLPDLAHGLNISSAWAEFTLSIYFIGFALGVFAWGVIADLAGRRPAMLFGIALYVLGSWGCYQSAHIASLLICRFFQAVGASAGSIVTQTMIRDVFSGVKRSQIFSLVGGILALSPALGPFLGGYIDDMAGWRGNFAFLVGLGGLLLAYSFLKLPETQPLESKQRIPFKQVALKLFTDKRVLGYAILIGASNGIIFSYYAEAPFLFINLMHLTPTQYGLSGSVIAAASVLASWISHRLNGRHYRPELIILLGCYMMGLSALCLTYLAYEGFFSWTSHLHLGLILVLIGLLFFGIGLLIPNALSQALSAYQDAIGTAGALFGLLYYILIASFTFLMGLLHNGTAVPMPLYFLALAAVMYCALYGFILNEKPVLAKLQKEESKG